MPALYGTQIPMIGYLQSVISGERRGFFPAILRGKLLVLSWIYLGVVKLRRWLYSKGVPRARNLPCKVISVGNVAAGGSGKTPAVIAIARMFREQYDLSVAILSRGYRSQVRDSAVVSDGEKSQLARRSHPDRQRSSPDRAYGRPQMEFSDRHSG